MPLQNRVNPFGELCAFSARGLFMGNGRSEAWKWPGLQALTRSTNAVRSAPERDVAGGRSRDDERPSMGMTDSDAADLRGMDSL
jgi:hypothetical protein